MTTVDIIKEQFELRIFDECVVRINMILDLLTEEEVWYAPNESMNSIANLILHLNGNVIQWIGYGIGQQEDIRKRDEEFADNKTMTKQELKDLMQSLKTKMLNVITHIEESDLLQNREVQGFKETGLSIMIHVIEHFSYHTGQIAQMAKLIKNVDLKFYDGLDLNTKTL